MQKRDYLLLIVVCCAVLLPVGTLCFLLTEPAQEAGILMIADFPAACLIAVPYIPFCLLLWRVACCGVKGKPLRLMLGLAGAAGVIAPVMLCQAQAYGLCGLWQLVWCGALLQCCSLIARDRAAAVMASVSAALGVPCMVYSFMLAVSRAAP